VATTTLSSGGVVPTLVSVNIVAGTTVGYPASRKTYLVQMHMDAGADPEKVSCKQASLELTI